MNKKTVLIASLASVIVLSGCSQKSACCEETKPDIDNPAVIEAPKAGHSQVSEERAHSVIIVQQAAEAQAPKKKKPELMKISGIGYGAESTFGAYTPGQRRLMAIRSSKLDAYRALAEQIHGIKIDSNTSVSTLTAKSDSFRARVNAVVRGARIVSVTPMADNNYETVLEVYVDKAFFEKAFVYTGEDERAVEPETAYQVSSY